MLLVFVALWFAFKSQNKIVTLISYVVLGLFLVWFVVGMTIAGWGFIVIPLVLVYIPLMYAVYYLAKKYGRPTGIWVFVSLIISPIICLIILLCIGETDEKKRERIREEELFRKSIREGDI